MLEVFSKKHERHLRLQTLTGGHRKLGYTNYVDKIMVDPLDVRMIAWLKDRKDIVFIHNHSTRMVKDIEEWIEYWEIHTNELKGER
jgi:hypothetical protein